MTMLARQPRPNAGLDDHPPASAGVDLNAVLGRGSVFEGKLAFEGTVHINGTFTGEIHSNDTLVVGEGARVEGDIDVGTLIVTGEVNGHVRAKQAVEMHAPARVKGTIVTPSLLIERGVVFEGTTRMENLEGALAQTIPPTRVPTASA
jgi:cytoskeletal protein CcmA (bactofilin family)